jgi:hypothetical protein
MPFPAEWHLQYANAYHFATTQIEIIFTAARIKTKDLHVLVEIRTQRWYVLALFYNELCRRKISLTIEVALWNGV